METTVFSHFFKCGVSLIEKAWAKVHGNYDRIVMGSCDLGFACLCGVPSFTFKNNEYRGARKLELWQEITSA